MPLSNRVVRTGRELPPALGGRGAVEPLACLSPARKPEWNPDPDGPPPIELDIERVTPSPTHHEAAVERRDAADDAVVQGSCGEVERRGRIAAAASAPAAAGGDRSAGEREGKARDAGRKDAHGSVSKSS